MAKPRKFDSSDKLEDKINEYFEECKTNDDLPTWAGMCLYIKTSPDTILTWRTDIDNYPGFADVIKRAELKHCHFWQKLAASKPNLQSFCIFELKQPHNGGFVDKQQLEAAGELKINVKLDVSEQ